MRVLVACEISGRVRDAFRSRGHDAYSCDILPSDNEFHIQCDVREILHHKWDLMIAHPPCTDLAVSGARWFKSKLEKDPDCQKKALDFVRVLMYNTIPRICVENPVSIISTHIRKPDQIIQPWQFGHGETKATCLWLKNLPLLKPTKLVEERDNRIHFMSPGPNRGAERSVTYEGIAEAMAEQWSKQ